MSAFNHAQNAFVQGNVTSTQVYGDQTTYNAEVVNISSHHQGSPLKGVLVVSLYISWSDLEGWTA